MPATHVEWTVHEEFLRKIYEQDLEGVVEDVLAGHIEIDAQLPPLDEIGDIPSFIPQPTLVRWKGGDTALHFALREQKRESVTILVELGAKKDGEEIFNEHDEDPRSVAQTIDHYTDAAETGDFEPIEPLLDPYETVHVAVATFDPDQTVMSTVVDVNVRLTAASSAASKALIQCEADTTESFCKKLSKTLPVNLDVQMILFDDTEVAPGETLMLNGLFHGCYVYLLRRKDPVKVAVRGWTGKAIKPLPSPPCPVEDHDFIMEAFLRDQYIRYEATSKDYPSTPLADLQQAVYERDEIEAPEQVLTSQPTKSDNERLQDARDKVANAENPVEEREAKAALLLLVKDIEQGAHVLYDSMSDVDKNVEPEIYVGVMDGSKNFGSYKLQPKQTIVVSPTPRDPIPETPKRITMWHQGVLDNVGAAFVKTKHTEKNTAPAFVPQPCWSGEELVAYGNLNTGKWEADLACNPKDTYAMRRLGRAHAAVGLLDEAVEFYERALEIDPEYHYARRDLAIAFFLQGKVNQALLLLRKVLEESDEHYAQAWCDIGDVLASEGDWPGAETHYQKALEKDLGHNLTSTATTVPTTSGEAAALRGLGCCACANNKFDEAMVYLNKSLLLAPADHFSLQLVQMAQSKTAAQTGDREWREHNRLAMIAGQLLLNDPTQAAHAAKCIQAGVRGNKNGATPADLLKLGSALYMKQGSIHAAGAALF